MIICFVVVRLDVLRTEQTCPMFGTFYVTHPANHAVSHLKVTANMRPKGGLLYVWISVGGVNLYAYLKINLISLHKCNYFDADYLAHHHHSLTEANVRTTGMPHVHYPLYAEFNARHFI